MGLENVQNVLLGPGNIPDLEHQSFDPLEVQTGHAVNERPKFSVHFASDNTRRR